MNVHIETLDFQVAFQLVITANLVLQTASLGSPKLTRVDYATATEHQGPASLHLPTGEVVNVDHHIWHP